MKGIIKKILALYSPQRISLGQEKGATMIEYALMVALIAIVATTAVKSVGTTVNTKFSSISSSLG